MDIGFHVCTDLLRSCIIMWADVMFLLVLCFIVFIKKMLFVLEIMLFQPYGHLFQVFPSVFITDLSHRMMFM